MAVFFGISQGQVSHRVGVLTPLVNQAPGRELLLRARARRFGQAARGEPRT